MNARPTLLISLALLLILPGVGRAAETLIDIRAISHDGKFIGSSMGGVGVILRNAETGAALAEGVIAGSTGDTDRILKTPRERGFILSTPDAAVFHASVDIDEPTLVELTASGPLAQRQSMARATATRWILPGKHLTNGDGWLIELPGLAVDVLAPAVSTRIKHGTEIDVSANVVLMCGCPYTDGGLWNARAAEVAARIKFKGKTIANVRLEPAGAPSRFSTRFVPQEPGVYEIVVSAHDGTNGNAGVDFTTVVVE